MFSTQSDNFTPFVHIFDIIFLFVAELEEPIISIWGKGLNTILPEYPSNIQHYQDDGIWKTLWGKEKKKRTW